MNFRYYFFIFKRDQEQISLKSNADQLDIVELNYVYFL